MFIFFKYKKLNYMILKLDLGIILLVYEGLLRHAMSNSILFRKFLPSIFSSLISLKAPPRFSHFLSWTNSLAKKSFLGDCAMKTWIPTDGSHLIAIILSPGKQIKFGVKYFQYLFTSNHFSRYQSHNI